MSKSLVENEGPPSSDEGFSLRDLHALAIAPIDPKWPLERKVQALLRNLGIAEFLDQRASSDFSTEDARQKMVTKGVDEHEMQRFYSRLALVAVLEFLASIDDDAARSDSPRTLKRLARALNELDDSGSIDPLLNPKTKGRPRPTKRTQALRAAAAAQLQLRYEQLGNLELAAKEVAHEMAYLGEDAPGPSAIKQWRDAVTGRPTNAEGAFYYQTILASLSELSLEEKIERTSSALRRLNGGPLNKYPTS